MNKNEIQLVPVAKAAEEFGVNRQTIINWHDEGLLQGTTIKGNRFVTRESLEKLKGAYPEAALDANRVDAYRNEIASLQEQLKEQCKLLRKERIYRHYAPRFVQNMIDKFVNLMQKMDRYSQGGEMEEDFIRCWLFGHDVKETCEKHNVSSYICLMSARKYTKLLRKMDDYAEMAEKYREMDHELHMANAKLKRLQEEMDDYRSRCKTVDNEENWKEQYDILTKELWDLDLTVRTLNVLQLHDFKNLAEVIKLSKRDLLKLRHFGNKSLIEIENMLEPYGLKIGTDISNIPVPEQEG